jgi:hypothetical protein
MELFFSPIMYEQFLGLLFYSSFSGSGKLGGNFTVLNNPSETKIFNIIHTHCDEKLNAMVKSEHLLALTLIYFENEFENGTPFLPISVNHTGNLLHFYLWQ